MTTPIATQKAPYPVEVAAGETYYWCACGKSAKQPLCDGSHAGSGLAPKEYKAEKTGKVYFCGCRASQNGALCDGSHKKL
jgi:CDGSH-type Zn-finger protein